jgi:hypothetical protein
MKATIPTITTAKIHRYRLMLLPVLLRFTFTLSSLSTILDINRSNYNIFGVKIGLLIPMITKNLII